MSGLLTHMRAIVFVVALLIAVLFVQVGATASGIAAIFGTAAIAAQRVVRA